MKIIENHRKLRENGEKTMEMKRFHQKNINKLKEK